MSYLKILIDAYHQDKVLDFRRQVNGVCRLHAVEILLGLVRKHVHVLFANGCLCGDAVMRQCYGHHKRCKNYHSLLLLLLLLLKERKVQDSRLPSDWLKR